MTKFEDLKSNQDIDEIKDLFSRYEDLRQLGLFNMLDPKVQEVLNIDKKTHSFIIRNYSKVFDGYEMNEFDVNDLNWS